uniref:Ribosomal protein L14 n=2 Tax=Pavlovaceae TaxID=418969 RepID=E9P699_DIALT|nr:ribosomal protein L14 [Diacronema lutheri]QHD45379.1 ribosomal protein L14 [Pavlova sp. NIVA-4/92]
MIRKQTILQIIDNSGARFGLCISTPLGFVAGLGDKVLLSIQSCSTTSKLKKGELFKAIIVRLKKCPQKVDGSSFSFQNNGVILLNSQDLPLAKRISGPVSYNLRRKKAFKVLFLANIVL